MEFKEILRRRRSVRKYLSRPVEREVLDTVLREALAAPSSRNSHSTHLRVLTDPETIARIARMRDYGSAFLEHAPAVVLVEGDRTATTFGVRTRRSRRRPCCSRPPMRGWPPVGCM